MQNNIEKLLNEFHRISSKRWVKGINNNQSSVGLTFEALLGKKVDSEMFPDFYNIEIKCSQRFSRYPIGLFNKSFDGPELFETNNIVTKYGTLYNEATERKYLFVNLVTNEYVLVNEKFYFRLEISKPENKNLC